jgi:hypothetical protein
MVDLTRSIPDHSLLSLTMTLNFSVKEFVNQYHYSSDESCFKTKYDVKQPPQDWLGNDFVECIKSEMLSKLPHRTFRICGVLVINLGDVRNSGGIWS